MSVIRSQNTNVTYTDNNIITRVELDPKIINVESNKVVKGGYGKKVYSADIENRIAAVNELKGRLAQAEADIEYLNTVAADATTAEIERIDQEKAVLEQYVYDMEAAINAALEIPEVTAVQNVAVEVLTNGALITWARVPFVSYYKLYLNGEVIVDAINATSYLYSTPLKLGNSTFAVEAYSETNTSSGTVGASATFALDPVVLNVTLNTTETMLAWGDIEYAVGYRVVHNDEVIEQNLRATSYVYKVLTSGNHTFEVYPVTAGGELGTPGTYTVAVEVPLPPVIDVKYVGENIVLNWDESNSTYPIRHYIITQIDGLDTYATISKTTTYSTKVTWSTMTFTVQAVDVVDNMSSIRTTHSYITAPEISSVTSEVIDNNVLLYWTPKANTLPVKEVEIRKGDKYSSAVVVGNRVGTFTTLFEAVAGFYTYWFTPIDSAGNVGDPVQTTAYMNEPPDYILNIQWFSDFSGTKSNCLLDNCGRLIMGIDVNETYQDHYINNGHTTIQDQIDDGYEYYLQPNLLEAYYEEVFDYEAVIGSTNISVTLTKEQVGTVDFQIDISVSSDQVTWTTYEDTSKALAANFRYVKVRVSTASDDAGFMWIKQIEVKLDSKQKDDAGNGVASKYDTNGTYVTFNRDYVDIISLSITPQRLPNESYDPRIAIYDFEDVGNAEGFYVYIYDISGNRIDSNFSWTAKGY